jgi:hypothetical protein
LANEHRNLCIAKKRYLSRNWHIAAFKYCYISIS